MEKEYKKASHANPLKVGQKLYSPFTIEIFDSRNTSYEHSDKFSNEEDAKLFTKFKSVPFKAVLHDYHGNWVEYENGTVTAWSSSLGTDKVPV